MEPAVIDVHQHLWPPELIEALRRRSTMPRLEGWTLHLDGEPPYPIDPADHDPARRLATEAGLPAEGDPRAEGRDAGRRDADPSVGRRRDAKGRAAGGRDAGSAAGGRLGADIVVVGPSSPLGLEWLPPEEAAPLIEAWHRGALALPEPFRAWASVALRDPDPTAVTAALRDGCVGLQVPADAMAAPEDVERLAPVLNACAELGRPVLVHPGAATSGAERPGWWAAVVDYVGQMQAAWWSWQVAGRAVAPGLRICFAAGAGLAPVQHERYAARGGPRLTIDPDVFVETSSYGRQAVDALTRVLGIDVIVYGTDRPYAEPAELCLGDAATHAIRRNNPRRLLEGGQP